MSAGTRRDDISPRLEQGIVMDEAGHKDVTKAQNHLQMDQHVASGRKGVYGTCNGCQSRERLPGGFSGIERNGYCDGSRVGADFRPFAFL